MPLVDPLESLLEERKQARKSERQQQAAATPTIAVPADPSEFEGLAADDLKEAFSLKTKFQRASKKYAVPTEILAGMASRESRMGKHLNEEGYDPDKKAFGILQVDERYHKRRGTKPDDQAHIDQAAEILRSYRNQMDRKFPDWSDDERWRGAVAAYNMGPGNVRTLKDLDKGTTGDNYSEDVMARAKFFRSQMEQKAKKK